MVGKKKQIEPLEPSEVAAILAGTCILVGGICYWIGFKDGVSSVRSIFIKTLNDAIKKGEIIFSVETATKAAKWFQLTSLPEKPTNIIPVGNGWTI